MTLTRQLSDQPTAVGEDAFVLSDRYDLWTKSLGFKIYDERMDLRDPTMVWSLAIMRWQLDWALFFSFLISNKIYW